MTDKPKKLELDTQPAYDAPQALRMGDIRAGTGGTGCDPAGSGASPCGAGNSAVGECLGDGTGAGYYCTTTGNSPAIPE